MDRKCLVGDYKLKQPLQYSQRFGKNMSICGCLDLTKLNIYMSQRGLFSVEVTWLQNVLTLVLFIMQPCYKILNRPTSHTLHESF